MSLRFALVVAFMTLAAACAACSSGDSKKFNPPNPATRTALANAPTAAPSATALSTPEVAALQTVGAGAQLVPYTDADGRYTISIPKGWVLHQEKDAMTATLPGTPATAQFGIACTPGIDVDERISLDQKVEEQIQEGELTLKDAHPITVAGVAGQEVPWRGENGGVKHGHWFVYFQSHGCAWRIVLNTFPNVDENAMVEMFHRILGTFQFS